MVIKMDIKNVIQRGGKFHFRMRVPKDCVKKIGKREIVQSLKTNDPLEARKEAQKLEKIWVAKFNEARTPSPLPPPGETRVLEETDIDSFRQQIQNRIDSGFRAVLDKKSESTLLVWLNYYRDAMEILRQGSACPTQMNFPEIGIKWCSKTTDSPGLERRRRKVLYDALQQMSEIVRSEMTLGIPDKPEAKKPIPQPASTSDRQAPSSAPQEGTNISEAAELMLRSKKRISKTETTLRADIRILQEWTGKSDLRDFTKRDLVDFITNCLPYIPANMSKKEAYRGKSIRDCVAMVHENPGACEPISYVTCCNRLVNISMLFNYAKDYLGVIPVNPVKGIEVPAVRVTEDLLRGFSSDELAAMWGLLPSVLQEKEKPSRFWVVVLSLYHGLRLNEACGLFLKDVYEDEDGIYVISINADEARKSVKNKSSIRVIPVHPFVRDQLGFRAFVEEQQQQRSQDTLFTDVVWNENKGYRDRMTKWFANWKKEWLPAETRYKHFHDLRYTFIQTAQNVAKMPDRHAQEITGHSIAGVSDVHLTYSGRLKPVDLLPELEKVGYGWENG